MPGRRVAPAWPTVYPAHNSMNGTRAPWAGSRVICTSSKGSESLGTYDEGSRLLHKKLVLWSGVSTPCVEAVGLVGKRCNLGLMVFFPWRRGQVAKSEPNGHSRNPKALASD